MQWGQNWKLVSGQWANHPPPYYLARSVLLHSGIVVGGRRLVSLPCGPIICPQQHPWEKRWQVGTWMREGGGLPGRDCLDRRLRLLSPGLGPDLHWGVIVTTPDCVCGVNHFRAPGKLVFSLGPSGQSPGAAWLCGVGVHLGPGGARSPSGAGVPHMQSLWLAFALCFPSVSLL